VFQKSGHRVHYIYQPGSLVAHSIVEIIKAVSGKHQSIYTEVPQWGIGVSLITGIWGTISTVTI